MAYSATVSPPLKALPPPFEPKPAYLRSAPASRCVSSRRLVVCLDGTGNTFGTGGVRPCLPLLPRAHELTPFSSPLPHLEQITNIPTLFSLASEDPDKQLLYYQVGIGQSISTHESNFAPGKIYAKLAAMVDEAVGFSLGQHICGAYQFLMDVRLSFPSSLPVELEPG